MEDMRKRRNERTGLEFYSIIALVQAKIASLARGGRIGSCFPPPLYGQGSSTRKENCPKNIGEENCTKSGEGGEENDEKASDSQKSGEERHEENHGEGIQACNGKRFARTRGPLLRPH